MLLKPVCNQYANSHMPSDIGYARNEKKPNTQCLIPYNMNKTMKEIPYAEGHRICEQPTTKHLMTGNLKAACPIPVHLLAA